MDVPFCRTYIFLILSILCRFRTSKSFLFSITKSMSLLSENVRRVLSENVR